MNSKSFFLTCFFLCLQFAPSTTFSSSAEFYSTSDTLWLSSVNVDGQNFGRVRLKLNRQGHLELAQFSKLTDIESRHIDIIDNSPCSPAGVLEKFAIYLAQISGDDSYCMLIDELTTVEGGHSKLFLLVETGGITFVVDNREDGLSQCCLEIYSSFTTMEFGVLLEGFFQRISSVIEIDLSRRHIIRLTTDSNEVFEF